MSAELDDGAVAIIGMACRYPGARDVAEFWAGLRAGADGISRFDPAEAVRRGMDPAVTGRDGFVPAKGVMAGSGDFDWTHFGYSRAEAAGIDPQQRVFLACAATAVDDAGIDPTRFPGWIGVYAGADVAPRPIDPEQSEMARVIGREKDFLATRVAYKLGLRGPAVTVQTACSTSLTAVHMAARALVGYECDVALAGGVAVIADTEWGYLYEPGGILSPDGRCRPFDADAAGTVPSEGVGVVVLKRLSDALRDGDRIAAVVLGSAINNDGSDKIGYTAPSVTGQREVVAYAQRVAGIDPAELDHVEAHGTATRIGDPIEVQALADAFGSDRAGWCLLGAVKGNIGHTGAAAGVAGVIKTALMLERREVVPTAHFRAPNPMLDLAATPFAVSTEHAPWPERGRPLAAVSSFGVGGTNAHAILGAAPERTRGGARRPRVVAVSATTEHALERTRAAVAESLLADAPALDGVAKTLAGRRAHRHRWAVVAEDTPRAARDLAAECHAAPPPLTGPVFLFPGQGALRSAAAGPAHRLLGGFRARFDEVADLARTRHGVDLSPAITEGGDPDWFADTVNQQLGLFAVGYALAGQLADWGVRPAALFGNSVGEYTAATLAGVWTPEDAVALVHTRAAAMWRTTPGVMLAVRAGVAEVLSRLDPADEVSVAVVGPGRTVLSGRTVAVEKLVGRGALADLDVRPLGTERAFHSPEMEPAAAALRAALAGVTSGRPRLPLISNETGGWADPDAVTRPEYWTGQLLNRVDLAAGAGTLLAGDHGAFLELGPGASMIAVLREHPGWTPDGTTIPLLGHADHAERGLLGAVAALWERGVDRALEDVAADPDAVRLPLPTHPFAEVSPDAAEPVRRVAVAAPRRSGQSTLADIWCAVLGVRSAVDSDDFFAVGGESLMLIDLANRVRERTGTALPIAEFAGRATFGELVRLAGPVERPIPRGVVELGGTGTGTPLFLAADAFGSALGYRHLAEHLDRPVYGLEPADLSAGDLVRIAVDHAEAVVDLQPDGPYLVGGWSFGAVVAHEVAHQLEVRGREVALLVGIDGFTPVAGRPVGTDPGHLLGGLRSQAAALLGVGPLGAQARRVPALRRRFVGNVGALLRYRPPRLSCPAVVFLADADERAAGRLRAKLSRLHSRDVPVHPVRGDHWSMLATPHVHALAARLRAALPEPAFPPGDDPPGDGDAQ